MSENETVKETKRRRPRMVDVRVVRGLGGPLLAERPDERGLPERRVVESKLVETKRGEAVGVVTYRVARADWEAAPLYGFGPDDLPEPRQALYDALRAHGVFSVEDAEAFLPLVGAAIQQVLGLETTKLIQHLRGGK